MFYEWDGWMFPSNQYRPLAIMALGLCLGLSVSGCSYDLPSLRGDTDKVPQVEPASAPAPDPIETGSIPATDTPGKLTVVQVRPGDTLHSIARAHRLEWYSLAEANRLEPPFRISVGQTLILPPAPD